MKGIIKSIHILLLMIYCNAVIVLGGIHKYHEEQRRGIHKYHEEEQRSHIRHE
jgi:hypothetical protein